MRTSDNQFGAAAAVADGWSLRPFQTATTAGKSHNALTLATASGPKSPVSQGAVTLVTGDNIADDTTTTSVLSVGGPHVISTIDTPGDQDFFRVELQAGQLYEIGMYLTTSGPNSVPLPDAYIELYDANGTLIVSADGGGPNTPSGLDALLSFKAETTGTYFVNARAFDNDTPDGATTTGDFVGDYELFARVADPYSNPYVPYYSPDSPLYSIDWGTQIDKTSRNPDGEEGPRPTGNAFVPPAPNPYGITGKNVITYYLAKAGEIYVAEDPANPGITTTMVAKGMSDWEKDAFKKALHQYELVADLIYVEVQTRADADLKFITYNGTPGPVVSLLGEMSPPGEPNEGQGQFNALDQRWTQAGLQQGGSAFETILHEVGHGHGMAHPHDNGGRSGIMRGTDDGSVIGGGLGDFDLNQSVFTVMSYNAGWVTSPYGQPDWSDDPLGLLDLVGDEPYGHAGTISPLDIAVYQDKYGVNEETNTGADTYTLPTENGPGTFFSAIWDAGGDDKIVFNGTADAHIDLRPASLQYEEGGGGFMSYAWGIHGGFTIANGVTIEEAAGGSGDDSLIGNGAANVLKGNAGNDAIAGGLGNDTSDGGSGNDAIAADAGNDTIIGGGGLDRAVYTGARSSYTTTRNADGSWTIAGPGGSDTVSSLERLVFDDQTLSIRLAPVNDFGGEGQADFLFETELGQAAIWQLDGTSVQATGTANSIADPAWALKGAGDFDGDGRADLLWQTTSGQAAIWEMNGTEVLLAGTAAPSPGLTWHIKGTGDFNGDAMSDILWETDSHRAAIWEMNGTQVLFGDFSGPQVAADWHIVGSGDFNGDARSDILWRTDAGQAAIWEMNGTQVLFGDLAGPNPGSSWQVRGTGDFNGDGKSDILWQTGAGQAAIWEMDGTQVLFGDLVSGATAGLGWQVKGAQDLNGDGKSDIVWQGATGQMVAWLMNGTSVTSAANVGSAPGLGWQFISPSG